MSFMEPQMTEKQWWVQIDGNCGVDCILAELVDLEKLRTLLDSTDGIPAKEDLRPLIGDYTENNQYFTIEIVKGYGVRSSAPGYMDCTSWEVYSNLKEAKSAYAQHRRECKGEND